MISVDVAISTYNGSKYLRQQLDSIYSQKDVHCNLYVRDDKSTDDTISILSADSSNFLVLQKGEANIGAKLSFSKLIREIPTGNFVALADQDDIWFPDKLYRAVERLKNYDYPAMYCSNVLINESKPTCLPKPQFPLNFFQNSAMGCTIVINSYAHEILKKFDMNQMIMHDWGILLLIQSVGKVEFDYEASMKYRIHAEQAIGLRKTFPLKRVFQLNSLEKCISQFIDLQDQLNKLGFQVENERAFRQITNLLECNFIESFWILFTGRSRFRDEVTAEVIFRMKLFFYLNLRFNLKPKR
jgi:rhamnosyltransferase